MRPSWLALLLVTVALPTASGDTPPASAAASPLRIVEFASDPAAGLREFVEVENMGNATFDLLGHRLLDASGSTFTFPTWPLASGARVVVWSGGAADASGPAWSASTVWNNGGDTIRLQAPDQADLDQVVYGAGGVPAPSKGKSQALGAGGWSEGEPTAGFAPGAGGFALQVEVANVPPTATLTLDRTAVAAGEKAHAVVKVGDANGPSDVVSWELKAGSAVVASGTSATESTVDLPAPGGGSVELRLTAVDRAGAQALATAAITLALGLVVEMPPGTLAFPPFTPGALEVTATRPFTVRNAGDAPAQPILDVSDLRGPGGTLPVAGHLQVGWTVGNATLWLPYQGPLTRLPELAAHTSADVLLRFTDVPLPLAAGSYGATFTVVA